MVSGETFVREMRRKDISAVLEIQNECGLKGWTQGDYLAELDREDSLTLLVCNGEKTDARWIKSGDRSEQIFGFAHLRLIMSIFSSSNQPQTKKFNKSNATLTKILYPTAEMYNFAVHPDQQGRGIGQFLFEHVLERLKIYGTNKIWLEVRASNNRAIGFYRRNGFLKAGTRKNYYTNPTEDALILRREEGNPERLPKN